MMEFILFISLFLSKIPFAIAAPSPPPHLLRASLETPTPNEENAVSNTSHRLYPRSARSDFFMENFVKGAGLWTELEHTLSDPSAKDTVDSVVLSLAKDQRTTMEDKGGWGYYTDDDPSEDPSDREEEALRLMGLEDDVEFIYAKAWLWRNPDFFLSGIYNCQHGIWSTQSTYIKYQSDPGKPPGSPDRLSEVMWALWMKVCPNEVENLRWIIQDHASNQNSLKLLKEAAQARDNYNEHDLAAHSGDVTTWEPGIFETPITAHSCDQAAGACDFYSILRAPNTIGVAYLLKDKAQRLRKTISRISAFYLYDEEADEDIRLDMWNILIEIAPISQC